jgi:hypothetical protein
MGEDGVLRGRAAVAALRGREIRRRARYVWGVADRVRFVAVGEILSVWEEDDGDVGVPDTGTRLERLGRAWVVSDRVLPRQFEPLTVILRVAAPGEGE